MDPVRAIAHFDLDAFFVSVERLKDPSLNGKPLIVGWRSDRGVVAACSYETRRHGVHSALPMSQALRLCPEAIVVPPSREDYSRLSAEVTALIAGEAPVFEKASIDEFYLDLTGLERFFGCYGWACALREKIMARTGLPISFALSVNKLVSKIATDTVKPNGHIEIPPGTEEAFLAPLAVEKIPMVGPETALQLHKVGIFSIRQLAATPRDTLRTLFGKQGRLLWERARGIDTSPVVPDQEAKSLSSETTFETNLTDFNLIAEELMRLNRRNAHELRKAGKFTACVAVKIRYGDFQTVNRQMTVPLTSGDRETSGYVRELLEKYLERGRPVRLLGVRYTHLTDQGPQPDLFTPPDAGLDRTLDALRDRFGEDSVFTGS